MSDVLQRDRLDGVDQDFTLIIHSVPLPHLSVRAFPDPDTASYEPAAHTFPKAFGENHWRSEQFISLVKRAARKARAVTLQFMFAAVQITPIKSRSVSKTALTEFTWKTPSLL